mgnify:CR=1 FL=1
MLSEQDVVVLKQLMTASKETIRKLDEALSENNLERASKLKRDFLDLSDEIRKMLKNEVKG